MKPIESLRRLWANTDKTVVLLTELRDANTRMANALERGANGHATASTGSDPDIEVFGLVDIAPARINLHDELDPITPLKDRADFQACAAFFRNSPSAARALVSPESQALLYSLIRALTPRLVVEIGTFRASTTEAMARAVHANGAGLVHTIDPFGATRVPPVLAAWPEALRACVRFSTVNSMTFFAEMAVRSNRAGLIFIDGNHDHEFALFDIQSAARFLEPGGIIAVDNVSQPGPNLALRDFLFANPTWKEIGGSVLDAPLSRPFDPERTRIHNTDMALVRAPRHLHLTERPFTLGQAFYKGAALRGARINIAEGATGTLTAQFIVRTFVGIQRETVRATTTSLAGERGPQSILLDEPFALTPYPTNTVEVWYSWVGDRPLQLSDAPTLA